MYEYGRWQQFFYRRLALVGDAPMFRFEWKVNSLLAFSLLQVLGGAREVLDMVHGSHMNSFLF